MAEEMEGCESSAVTGERHVFAISVKPHLLGLACFACVGVCVCVTMTCYHLISSLGWEGKWNIVSLLLIHFRNTWEVS